MNECKFCKTNEKTLIKEFDNWYVSLNSNQYYLGRQSIILNRHFEDFSEINNNERDELFEIMRKSKSVIGGLFNPEMFNYYVAGNVIPHVYMHLIPRYNHDVEFGGFKFREDFFGQNHSFYPRDFKIEDDLLIKIRDEVKSKF